MVLPPYTENMMEYSVAKSRVAVLGMLDETHWESAQYNLDTLRSLVKSLQPDLLCAEISTEDWQSGDIARLPLVYREVLVPLSRLINTVIVPVCSSHSGVNLVPKGGRFLGFRALLVRLLNKILRWMQRLADSPKAVNSTAFGALCHTICILTLWLCGPSARQNWDEAYRMLFNNILSTIRHDPMRRVLVTVDCRHQHQLITDLKRLPEVDLVDYHLL